ncbi:hypothetical protein GCM10009629_34550 [Pseudonocardia alni]
MSKPYRLGVPVPVMLPLAHQPPLPAGVLDAGHVCHAPVCTGAVPV